MTFFASQPVCNMRALRSVSLKVEDPTQSNEFYDNAWGLSTVESDGDKFWLRGTGQEHHILQLEKAEQNALGKIAFALGSAKEVDDAGRRLHELGIPVIKEPGFLDDAAGGYGLQLVDPEGRVIELSAEVHAVTKQDPAGRRAVPNKIAHVVLNTQNIELMTQFFTQVLGMRVSDWSERQMSFLRCNSEHHVIALNQAPWASVNHVAYEMESIDHFMRGIGGLKGHGITPQWGPGRHGPGDNTFSYFTDPAGLVCEYTSEVEQIEEDAWLCRTWKRTPELSDQWGTAGPPTATVRSAMAGIQDMGYRAMITPDRDNYFIEPVKDEITIS